MVVLGIEKVPEALQYFFSTQIGCFRYRKNIGARQHFFSIFFRERRHAKDTKSTTAFPPHSWVQGRDSNSDRRAYGARLETGPPCNAGASVGIRTLINCLQNSRTAVMLQKHPGV